MELIVRLEVGITPLTDVHGFPSSRGLKEKGVGVYLFVGRFLSIRLLLIVIVEFVFVSLIQMMVWMV